MKAWSVAVGVGGLVPGSAGPEQVAAIAERLADLSPAVSLGADSLTVRVAVEADDAPRAGAAAVKAVSPALRAAGLGTATVLELEVADWGLFVERLGKPTYPELVGITEIAEILKTSRQRASELARSPKFPVPLADLAAGPVWTKPAVMRFAADWDRKPGRPRSALA